VKLPRVALFFLQAEDATRAPNVTGVQTFPLPNSTASVALADATMHFTWYTQNVSCYANSSGNCDLWALPGWSSDVRATYTAPPEIGRASCREGVSTWDGAGAMHKKQSMVRNSAAM